MKRLKRYYATFMIWVLNIHLYRDSVLNDPHPGDEIERYTLGRMHAEAYGRIVLSPEWVHNLIVMRTK